MTSTERSRVTIHPSACIDEPCDIGAGTKIWHFCHVSPGAVIGADCVLGQNVYVGPNVVIGSRVKVQNNVAIYSGTTVEDDVFLGPSCVLTNVKNPRAAIERKGAFEETLIRRGATVGANATIVCGVIVGRYSFIAAGAVVTGDVSDYSLVVGVPGRQDGFVSRHGHRLHFEGGRASCPESGLWYSMSDDGRVTCDELDETSRVPPSQIGPK